VSTNTYKTNKGFNFVILKFYKSIDNNIPSKFQKIVDDFIILVDSPFDSMSKIDGNKVLFGDFTVVVIELESLYIDYNQLAIENICLNRSTEFCNVIYIKCNDWLLGEIYFYEEEAYNVLKGWIEDAKAKHGN
jgi:hypothetical protein